MKKSKLLLLVLVAPLLTGCGKSSVKAPKFAKEGDKVEFDKFVEDLQKAGESSAIAKTDTPLKSAVIKVSGEDLETSELERGGKSNSKSSEYTKSSGEYQYDATNAILREKSTVEVTETLKSGKTKMTVKQTTKRDNSSESAQVSGSNYVVDVDLAAKEYYPETLISGDVTAAKVLDEKVRYFGNMLMYSFYMSLPTGEWDYYTDEEKAHWAFYENGNIFTFTYEDSVDKEEVKNTADEVIYLDSVKTSQKMQVDFTAGKMSFVSYYSYESLTEFKLATYFGGVNYGAGDVLKAGLTSAGSYTWTEKDVSLKATDFSKLTALGF